MYIYALYHIPHWWGSPFFLHLGLEGDESTPESSSTTIKTSPNHQRTRHTRTYLKQHCNYWELDCAKDFRVISTPLTYFVSCEKG